MMLASSSEARMVCARVESRPRETTWALADHPYAAAPEHAPRRGQTSLPKGAKRSRLTPPVMQLTMRPPTKRPRLEADTSQFVDGASNSGDSFRTPDSAKF